MRFAGIRVRPFVWRLTFFMKTSLFAAAACIAVSMSAVSQAEAADAGKGFTLMDMLRANKQQADLAKPLEKTRLSNKAEADDQKADTQGAAGKAPYHALISSYAKQYGVPVELASAVVKIESGFNPKARGTHGEVGLMQIKPATARAMGYTGTVAGLYDPSTNLKYGMKYLAMAHQLGGGDTCGAILRYNAGHGATRMNPVSKQYCGQVEAALENS